MCMNAEEKVVQKTVRTNCLEIAYEEWGAQDGYPVILLHGFPDDVRAWHDAAKMLDLNRTRIFIPYLRGFGPTRFLKDSTPKAGQQAAIGQDVLDFMNALDLQKAVLAGYDWGCRAACVASVLEPSRVSGLLAIGGYNIQDIKNSDIPSPPSEEKERWYHWYFNMDRGYKGLEANCKAICRMLWRDWSPDWKFTGETFEVTAKSFENPDFVPVVIQEYRHSYGNDPGDPGYDKIEQFLAGQPPITVPSIVLHGTSDTVHPLHCSVPSMPKFPKGTERIAVEGAGHFLPREKPEAAAEAIRKLLTLNEQENVK